MTAGRSGGRARLFAFSLVGVALLVALDLWSKAAVFGWLGWPHDPAWVEGQVADTHGRVRLPLLGEWFAFMPSLNYGAAWGMFGDHSQPLVWGRMAAVLLMLVLLWRTEPGQRVFRVALVLVTAGALGNLHDNLLVTNPHPNAPEMPFGPVRDFIDVYFAVWDWHFPIFNVADSCISVGAVLLLASGMFAPKPDAGEESGGGSGSGEDPVAADSIDEAEPGSVVTHEART